MMQVARAAAASREPDGVRAQPGVARCLIHAEVGADADADPIARAVVHGTDGVCTGPIAKGDRCTSGAARDADGHE